MSVSKVIMWCGAVLVVLCVIVVGYAAQKGLFSSSSTEPLHIGVTDGQLGPMPASPNAVSSQSTVEEKYVEPLPMYGDAAATRKHILTVLEKMGANTVKTDDELYIHTVFVTSLMRYHDDTEFLVVPEENRVHFRSASRVGYSDMGANRERYEAFKSLYIQ